MLKDSLGWALEIGNISKSLYNSHITSAVIITTMSYH